jgi:hypothetical protein
MSRALLLTSLVFAFGGCSRTAEPLPETRSAPAADSVQSAASAQPAASTASASPPAAAAREIVWTDPVGWQKVPAASPMRKATYRVPAAPKDPEDAEMAVFYFRGEGGSTEANIQRWISQFSDTNPSAVKRTQRNVGGMSQTIVEVEGTYASGMPGAPATPKPRYRLLGAVVETPAGPYFFKLTGPKKTVEAARDAYLAMLISVRSS